MVGDVFVATTIEISLQLGHSSAMTPAIFGAGNDDALQITKHRSSLSLDLLLLLQQMALDIIFCYFANLQQNSHFREVLFSYQQKSVFTVDCCLQNRYTRRQVASHVIRNPFAGYDTIVAPTNQVVRKVGR